MKKDVKEFKDGTERTTDLAGLIERLKEFPANTEVSGFVMNYVDGRGYKCKMEYKNN
jgi:hypothetical protein